MAEEGKSVGTALRGFSGRAWVGGEEEGVEAEPLVRSEKRGEGGGCSYGERRRRLRSASGEGAREARQGEREEVHRRVRGVRGPERCRGGFEAPR